jgi:hypothetical protein
MSGLCNSGKIGESGKCSGCNTGLEDTDCCGQVARDGLNGRNRGESESEEAPQVQALPDKNQRVKIAMADELIRMGFSAEAAARILNVNLSSEENL